jgi:hypothetical protein
MPSMFPQASAGEPNLKAYQFRDFPQPPVRTMSERLVVDNRGADAADHCRRIENGLLSRWKFPASIGHAG